MIIFQIAPKVNNPQVGANLHDHVTTLLGPFFINQPITFNLARLLVSPSKFYEYFAKGTGPLTTTVACDTLGFVRTKYAQDNLKVAPDVQYIINNVPPYSDYGALFYKMFGFETDWWNEFYSSHYAKDAVTILPVILRPKSRGRLMLQSSDPLDKPLIDPKYYDNPDDVKTMVAGIKKMLDLIEKTPELKAYG